MWVKKKRDKEEFEKKCEIKKLKKKGKEKKKTWKKKTSCMHEQPMKEYVQNHVWRRWQKEQHAKDEEPCKDYVHTHASCASRSSNLCENSSSRRPKNFFFVERWILALIYRWKEECMYVCKICENHIYNWKKNLTAS